MAGHWKVENFPTHYVYTLEWFIPSDAATCPVRTVDTEMVYRLRITVNQILAASPSGHRTPVSCVTGENSTTEPPMPVTPFLGPIGNLGLGFVSSFFSMQDIGYHPFLQNRVCMSQSVGSYFFPITYFN